VGVGMISPGEATVCALYLGCVRAGRDPQRAVRIGLVGHG
jgi:hypothetical protein